MSSVNSPPVIVGVPEFGQREGNFVVARHGFTTVDALEPIRAELTADELPTTTLNVGDTILDLDDDT